MDIVGTISVVTKTKRFFMLFYNQNFGAINATEGHL